MKFTTISRRMAATGTATALAAGALIGATSTTAEAAAGTNTYSCVSPVGTFAVPVTATLADLPATLNAGQPIADAYASPLSLLAGADLAGVLTGLGLTGLTSPDMALPFGSAAIPVTGIGMAGLPTPGPDAGSLVLATTGTTGAFTAPEAGTHNITMPASFTMVPSTTAFGDVPVPCSTTETPATLDTVEVMKNASATSLKAPARIKKGEVAKLVATVQGGYDTATGKVVFKDGTKKLGSKMLNDSGKAVFKAKGLKAGKHNITAKYVGDGYRTASKDKSVVKVVNP